MIYKIVKGRPENVDILHKIVKECGQDMKLRFGLEQWIPTYPLPLMRIDTEEKSVDDVYDGNQTIATLIIGAKPLDYYDMRIWSYPNKKAIYMKRLAVLLD